MHWLRQQRQQSYVQFLHEVDLCMKALEALSVALVGLSDRLDEGEVDADTYDFDPLQFPREVLERMDELGKSRDGLLMLGPAKADEHAQTLFSAIITYWGAHGDMVSALRSGPQPAEHPAWAALASTEDAALGRRREFIAAARSVLTDPPS
jgi:hypothetical protein